MTGRACTAESKVVVHPDLGAAYVHAERLYVYPRRLPSLATHQMHHFVIDLGGGEVGEGELAGSQLPHEDAKGVDITGSGQPAGT